ncbi:hypothetical protein CEP54_013670 [Fusarium duplospermum]|uniref:Adenylate kinase n=1 Tax=Fusarium duplospermum TaxID=1325734 RepID=A0A428P1A9_9HYPO|nr:hypothetical protein CEP54_013670 [Fusarium duplospermum]
MRVFIIDGFPRNILQLQYFEVEVGAFKWLIYLDCPEETLIHRLLPRGRFDDHVETIRGRLRTFKMITSEVIEYFQVDGKLKVLDGEQSIPTVHEQLKEVISEVTKLR